jgi:hypothetical protein
MLKPQQFGILACLVYDALVKYPNPPRLEEATLPEDLPFYEPWEAYLISEINRIPEMPQYEALEREVEMLVEYYGDEMAREPDPVGCCPVHGIPASICPCK